MNRIVVFGLWLVHWLPLPVLNALGCALGWVLYRVARRRRHIVGVNLRLCFPGLNHSGRRKLAKAHFAALGCSLVERGLLWWSSEARLRKLIRVENEEILQRLYDAGQPVILLAPHFLGLDAGGARIAMRFNSLSVYSRQNDPVIDRWLLRGRTRFGDQKLIARDEGVRSTVRLMKSGRPFYYLPDMNAKRKEAMFAPFFGIQAATISGLPRLARLAGAVVVPCPTRRLPGGKGYVVELGEPWENYPSGDVEADIVRMNAWIESVVRTMPEQYYWVHRRFKTRPEGEQRPY